MRGEQSFVRHLDHVFSVKKRGKFCFHYSKYLTALIVFLVMMEQLENKPIKERGVGVGGWKTISCSSVGYKCNFPVWLLDCSHLLGLN